MKEIKYLPIKIVTLIVFLFALNIIYKKYYFSNDVDKHSPILLSIQQAVSDSAQIVYLSESSNTTYHDLDTDKRAISEMIQDYYPTIKVHTIHKEATQANHHLQMLKSIKNPNNINTVIVTFNLRSFGSGWIYSGLETSLQKSLVLIKSYPPLVNRFFLNFKNYPVWDKNYCDSKIRNSWSQARIYDHPKYDSINTINKWLSEIDKHQLDSLRELTKHYVKNYGFNLSLDSDNPRLKDYDEIISLCKANNWKLILNLMAENLDQAQHLVGTPLVELFQSNVSYLKSRYTQDHVIIVDNLAAVKDDDFIDRSWPTEHYKENGRKAIAASVASSLKSIYSTGFVQPDTITKLTTKYFEGAEMKAGLSINPTVTREKSYTGKSSSKTGNGNDFSVGFNIPIKQLPDSVKKLIVDFYIFMDDNNTEAKLVFETNGTDPYKFYDSYKVIYITKEINKWTKLHYEYTLPELFNKSDFIKVYIWNTSKTNVYVDDLNLNFE
ncbi:MAG: hypothetical protein HOP11_04150 [Saprospiraceae bacterium]|nr:hypothetical protein [Saprospiraceae bacterium]